MPTTILKNPVNMIAASDVSSLHVTGAAADATATSGVQPADTLTVQGTTGQATTGAGQTAGRGANVSIVAGSGGTAPAGATNGAGGSVIINPGLPGAGAGTSAAHGNVLLATGGGNVGIGIVNPSAALSLASSTANTGGIRFGTDTALYRTADGNLTLAEVGGTSVPQFVINSSPQTGQPATLTMTSSNTSWNVRNDGTNFAVRDATNNKQALTITPNTANLGISNTNPANQVDIGVQVPAKSSDFSTLKVSNTATSSGGSLLKTGLRISSSGTWNGANASNIGLYVENVAGGTNNYDAIFNGGGNVGIGTPSPVSRLHVAGNSAPQGLLTIGLAENTASNTGVIMQRSRGTLATPSDLQEGDDIGLVATRAYSGSFLGTARLIISIDGPVVSGQRPPSRMTFLTNTGNGVIAERVRITGAGNVGIGTTAPTSLLHVNGGVQVGNPTGGDKGAGTINVSGDIYKNGSAYTNPDYVFEHHFNGSTQAAYAGPVPLSNLEDAIRTQGQLPGVGREPHGIFGRQDVLLEKLEEAYLYIIELTKRVGRLEAALDRPSGKENE